jgi:hypothetical protein
MMYVWVWIRLRVPLHWPGMEVVGGGDCAVYMRILVVVVTDSGVVNVCVDAASVTWCMWVYPHSPGMACQVVVVVVVAMTDIGCTATPTTGCTGRTCAPMGELEKGHSKMWT